ncbi:MAG: hypothetical protein NTW07_04295, partial [candidate division Zixibacteria bacterium]|nr:hypothetical protein [candidate division Zixibacteria bacterium]
MMKRMLCLAVLTLCGCSSEKAPHSFKFSFKPPDSVSFVVELSMTQSASLGDQKSMDSTWSLTHHLQRTLAEGYELTGRTDSVLMFRNGQAVHDPVIRLFAGSDITFMIDSTGMVKDVRGFEEMMNRLDGLVGPDTAAAVRRIVTPEALKQQEIETWNTKFGPFVNREMVLRQAYCDTSYPTMPIEGSLAMFGISELVDTLTVNGRLCGKLRVVSSTDPAELARLSERTEDEISKLFGLTTDATAQASQRQAGLTSNREWVLEF